MVVCMGTIGTNPEELVLWILYLHVCVFKIYSMSKIMEYVLGHGHTAFGRVRTELILTTDPGLAIGTCNNCSVKKTTHS